MHGRCTDGFHDWYGSSHWKQWLGTVADPKGTGWAVELDHS